MKVFITFVLISVGPFCMHQVMLDFQLHCRGTIAGHFQLNL